MIFVYYGDPKNIEVFPDRKAAMEQITEVIEERQEDMATITVVEGEKLALDVKVNAILSGGGG